MAGSLTTKALFNNVSVWNGFNGKKFKLCRIHTNNAISNVTKKSIKVTFSEDSSVVSRTFKKKLKKFMESLPKKGVRFSMKAHADQCGSDAYNLKLSNKRAFAVYNVIKDHYRFTRQIYLDTKGERESSGHHTHDRHVTLTAEFKTGPATEFKNIFLIDASHSFTKTWSYSGLRFSQIKKMKFPKDSLVYVVRATYSPCVSTQLYQYYPNGETYFKDAQALIALKSRGKFNVTVLSDGKQKLNKRDHRRYMSITNKAKRRKGGKISWFLQ